MLDDVEVKVLAQMGYENGTWSKNHIQETCTSLPTTDNNKRRLAQKLIRRSANERVTAFHNLYDKSPILKRILGVHLLEELPEVVEDELFPEETEFTDATVEYDEEPPTNHINTDNMVWKSSLHFLPAGCMNPRFEDEAEEMTFRFVKCNEDDPHAEKTKRSGDGGVDTLARSAIAQTKYKNGCNPVGEPEIRSFVGANQTFNKERLYFFGTNYTSAAVKYASRVKNLQLFIIYTCAVTDPKTREARMAIGVYPYESHQKGKRPRTM